MAVFNSVAQKVALEITVWQEKCVSKC